MTGFLKDRIVVITGGFGALGRALDHVATAEGARCILLDRTAPPPVLRGSPYAFGGIELADRKLTTAVVAGAAAHSKIDILINGAGSFASANVIEAETTLWLDLYTSNVVSAANVIQAALPHMRSSSLIINVAAAAAIRAVAGMAPYAAAKSGVLRLTEALAEELGDCTIRVYSASPSTLDTPRNRLEMPEADISRWISPEHLAASLLALWTSSAPSGKNFQFWSDEGR